MTSPENRVPFDFECYSPKSPTSNRIDDIGLSDGLFATSPDRGPLFRDAPFMAGRFATDKYCLEETHGEPRL